MMGRLCLVWVAFTTDWDQGGVFMDLVKLLQPFI